MPALEPVYLIWGSDRPKVSRAVHRLRERVGADNVEALSAAEASSEEVVAACNALGLLAGEARLVLVTEVERWKAADAKVIASYLASPAPETVLALVAEALKREAALAKACAKAGEVLVYDAPRKRDLPRWVAEQFARVGASAEPEACRALVELTGEDVQTLATEIEKLAAWAGGEPVTARDVDRLAAPPGDVPPWALTDAWGRRDGSAVVAAMEDALAHGDRSRADTVARLSASMAAHVRLVEACKRLDAEGVRPDAAAQQLGKRPFPVRKAYDQAGAFGVDELRAAIVRLAELDYAIKGGSRLSGELELLRALIDITARDRSVVGG
jgi:DNA polymerase III subunit delta